MPTILAAIVAILIAAVLLVWWFIFLRPTLVHHPMKESLQVKEITSGTDEHPVVMALMVLSWSEGLQTRFEAFIDSLKLSSTANVAISTKYAAHVVRRVDAVGGYLDSLAFVGKVDNDTISLASLPSVLRNGFANGKNGTFVPYHIVVMGGFPNMPLAREMNARNRSSVVLADEDYLWLAKSKDHRVVFITEKQNDPFRQALEMAMRDTTIAYHIIY